MENLTTSTVSVPVPVVVTASSGNMTQMSQIPSMAGVSNVNDIGLANMTSVPNVSQVVGSNPMPTISQVWYNCGPDGVAQLVATNPQSVIEINSNELTRQFNQQLQTPYGNIQLQVQPIPAAAVIKQDDIPVVEIHKPPTKTRVRQTGNERVPCPTCGKTVSCNATLRDHMRTHTGDRPFVCSECGFAFAQRSNLRMHKRLHTGERPYMCGICGKTFARSSHLPAHMRTHTGEKPFVCEECDHAFITAQQLKNHFRVHTGEKPWKCDICPAAFTHSSSLSTHKKKHTGMKPFQCEKCHKCFFFTSALDKHMKVHSKARPFKCDECDKSYKYNESLTVHREKYCGKEVLKKPRAARRSDARKPGPKPGNGRKYVQRKKIRPRGRPRKRGRWSARVKTRRNYQDMENMTGIDSEDVEVEIMNNPEEDDDYDDNKDSFSKILADSIEEVDDEIGVEIPTAELKLEVITPDESTDVDLDGQAVEFRPVHVPQAVPGDIIQVQSSHEIHMDDAPSLTIVSAEDGQQQVSAGGMQLITLNQGMPIQFVQQQEGGNITQVVNRDTVQMWYPRQ